MNRDNEIMSQTTAALVLTLLCSLAGVAGAMMVALVIAAGK